MSLLKVSFTALSLLLFCSCEKNSEKQGVSPKKVLKIGSKEDPFSLDPRSAGDRKSQAVQRLIYEGLTRLSSDGTPVPALAEKITISEDLKTYLFTLRDTRWSDGSPLTSEDVAYSWKKIISPDFASHYAYAFYDIVGVPGVKEGESPLEGVQINPISDRELQVILRHPTPYFLELLANPIFCPISKRNDLENPDWPKEGPFLSSGPFKLKHWKFKRCLSLQKNEHYHNIDKIHLDKIHISILPDEWTSLLLFENEDLDWVGDPFTNLPYDALPDLMNRDLLGISPSSAGFWYAFNVELYPFNHPKLRQAFANAINRKSLIKNILQANEVPALSILPNSMALRSIPLLEDNNLKLARTLFKEALEELGITKEDLPPIKITGTNKHLVLTQAIKEQWREAFDIDVRIQTLEWNVYLTNLMHRDFQIGSMGWESWYNDPIYNLNAQKYKNSKLNTPGWESADYIECLEKSFEVSDPALRKVYLKKAEEIIMSEMPIVPVYYSNRLYLKSPRLKNIYYTPLGNPEFIYADITPKDESSNP